MSDLDELKAEWFEFGRDTGLREAKERIIKLFEYQISWLLDQNTFEKTAEAEVWIKATKLVLKGRSKWD